MITNKKSGRLIKIGNNYVRAGTIQAVRCGIRYDTKKTFLTVDFLVGNKSGYIQVDFESLEERDSLFQSITTQINTPRRWRWLCTT